MRGFQKDSSLHSAGSMDRYVRLILYVVDLLALGGLSLAYESEIDCAQSCTWLA